MITTWRKFVFLTILVFVGLPGCSDKPTREAQETAESFFSAIAQQDYPRAHRFLSRSLARQTSVEGLRRFVEDSDLDQPSARSWRSAEPRGDKLTLAGSVSTGDQQAAIPVRLNLEKDGLHWKIAGLERGVEIATANGSLVLYAPSRRDSALLARQTTADFAAAISQNNLRAFWQGTADAYKNQFTAEQFEAAFAGFVREKSNLTPAARLDPQFSAAPAVTADGELTLVGQFPTRPSRVAFQYHYVRQDGSWKTSGMTISLVPQN